MALPAKNPLRALRSRAEDLVHTHSITAAPISLQELSHEAMRQMLHELQVHQIELEMQNEELRQTQLELDSARARYFDLYDLAPVGYCTVSEQGLVLEANFTAATMLNVVRSELVNKPISGVIGRSDQDTYYRCRKALIETGAQQDCELQMLRRGGDAFWVHMQVSAARDSTGKPVQRMVLSDISERRQWDAELRAKNQELEAARHVADKANQAKTDFLSNMTHELRSPLNAILGFAQLLEAETPAPSAAQITHIKQILRAGWYLMDLIGEILDLTSIESGQLKLVMEPVQVSGVLQESRISVAARVQKTGIQLHFGQVNAALQVHADRTRLQQVMTHLLSNAIQYNRIGGTVEVTCSVGPQQRLRISVRDTGFGLSAEKIDHLFQPFNRLGRETSAEEGTGVGLALSKRLVELMGGSIGAHSTVGVGSEFWIELRLSEDTQQGPLP
jgi:PAS domain S-box-containing protein